MSPGIYDGVSAEAYHADPANQPSLSNSIAKILLERSPMHAWTAHPRLNPDYEVEEDEDKFDFGSAAHAVLLENDFDCIFSIEATDWRTKAAKEARDEARARGKIPLLSHQTTRVRKMVAKALDDMQDTDLAGSMQDGSAEQTIIWKEGGVWCRCRVDWFNPRAPWDYKSTYDSEPSAFGRIMASMSYDFQMAFYQRGLRSLGVDAPYRLLAQEKRAPFDITVHGLSEARAQYADALVQKAIDLWDRCLQTNNWPGYDKRTHYQEITNWQMADYERMFIEEQQ